MSRLCGFCEPPGCMVDGDPRASLLIIAMAPGREELAHDKPLIGPSGDQLWKQLSKKAGVSRADCYIVNTIGEWPEGIDGNPTKVQFDKYWDLFDEAVGGSSARIALLLGKAALERFAGLSGGIEAWRGYLVAPNEAQTLSRTITREAVYKTSNSKRGIKKGDPKIEKVKAIVSAPWPSTVEWAIPTLHPAAILRSGFTLLPAFAADIARVGRSLRGELLIKPPVWTDGLPMSIEVRHKGPTVADIETGGINNGIITRIGATNGDEVWTSLWDNRSRDRLRDVLREGSVSVAFNIGFDAPRLADHGAPLPEPWWDVMLAAATVKPELKKSLNYVSSLYQDKQRHKHLSESNPAFYNAMDVSDTKDLYYILKAELERTGMLDLFERRMMPTVPTLVDMTKRGIAVDIPARDAWIKELLAQRDVTYARWEQLAPGQKTAGSRLLNYLYGELGLAPQHHKHGGETSDVSGMRKLLMLPTLSGKQRSTIETLLELRGIEKDLRTYAEVELDGDGRIHPGFLPAGKDTDSFGRGIAGTGRITSSGPNIQNQHQVARRMYRPSHLGLALLEGDWSQIEARIIAQLSGDEELKGAIREGLHTSNMRAFGVDKTRAKNGFYGWAYGAGKRTLHNTFIGKGFNVPEHECEALLRGFDRRFERAAAWRRRIADEVSTRYHLTNPFGRRRYFLGGSRDVPAGLDFQPQSSAADVMWTVLRPLADSLRGLDAHLLATVHDSVLIECPRERVSDAARVMREIMEQPWPELGGLSVPVEFKIGENWGSMEDWRGEGQ